MKPNTAEVPGLISSSLGWERVRNWNIGFDFGAFNNRLTGSFDYYNRMTLDMVGPAPELPYILGLEVPKTNNTDLKTYGFDLDVSWNDRLQNAWDMESSSYYPMPVPKSPVIPTRPIHWTNTRQAR